LKKPQSTLRGSNYQKFRSHIVKNSKNWPVNESKNFKTTSLLFHFCYNCLMNTKAIRPFKARCFSESFLKSQQYSIGIHSFNRLFASIWAFQTITQLKI
jgi:hypothetical protein